MEDRFMLGLPAAFILILLALTALAEWWFPFVILAGLIGFVLLCYLCGAILERFI